MSSGSPSPAVSRLLNAITALRRAAKSRSPSSVSSTRTARRSPGSRCRATRPLSSSPSRCRVSVGPSMPTARARSICERGVERAADGFRRQCELESDWGAVRAHVSILAIANHSSSNHLSTNVSLPKTRGKGEKMSRYECLLFVHVAAVIVWLGTGTALAFIAIYAERSRERALGEQLGTLAAGLGPRVFAPASLGTLVAGMLLVLDGSWTFRRLWIGLGLAAFAVSFLLNVGVRFPLLRRLEGGTLDPMRGVRL